MIQHFAPQSGIASSQNHIATAGYDNQVILWCARSGEALARGWHDHLANQVTFSSCGQFLASSGSDKSVRVWEVPSLRLLAVLTDHSDDAEAVCFHPERPWIATSSRDGAVRVFDLSGQLIRRLEGHTADALSVAWKGSSDTLVSSGDDGTIRMWNVGTGECEGVLDMNGIETDTIALASSGHIFAANDAGELMVIKDNSKATHAVHRAGIKRLIFNEEYSLLVSLSYDRTMKIWCFCPNTGNLTLVQEAELPPLIWPRSCAFNGRNELVFSTFGSTYASYRITTDSWELSRVHPTPGVNALAEVAHDVYTIGDSGVVYKNGTQHCALGSLCNFILPVDSMLVAGGQMGTIFDAHTGTPIYQHRSPLNCAVSLRRNGHSEVLVGTYTGELVVLRSTASGFVYSKTIPVQDNAIKSIATDGDSLFCVSATGQAVWLSAGDFSPRVIIDRAHDKIANGCASLGSGGFASVSRDLKLRIWKKVNNGWNCVAVPTPHTHSIKCVAASQCGRFICTASYGGTVAVYDTQVSEWVKTCRPTASAISSVVASSSLQDLQQIKYAFRVGSYDGRTYSIFPHSSEVF